MEKKSNFYTLDCSAGYLNVLGHWVKAKGNMPVMVNLSPTTSPKIVGVYNQLRDNTLVSLYFLSEEIWADKSMLIERE